MRYGLNALNVIDGVKKKACGSSNHCRGVEVVSGYDRRGLIQDSIKTTATRPVGRSGHRQRLLSSFSCFTSVPADPNPHFPIAVRRFIMTDVLPRGQFQHYVARVVALAIGVLVDARLSCRERYRHLSRAT